MQGKSFHDILTDKFPFEPTQSQVRGFRIIADFLTRSKNNEILLIKGYAGTGKTTLIGHLVKNLNLVLAVEIMSLVMDLIILRILTQITPS